MFSITVAFGPVAWLLLFRDKQKAEDAVKALLLPRQIASGFGTILPECVTDDFGQSVYAASMPTAIMLEDMDTSKLVHVEHQMRGVHVQAEVRKRAEADLHLRAARGGPAIVSPFSPMNGR